MAVNNRNIMDTETLNKIKQIKQNTQYLLNLALKERGIAEYNVELAESELSQAKENYELALQEAKEKNSLVKAAHKQNNKALEYVNGFIKK